MFTRRTPQLHRIALATILVATFIPCLHAQQANQPAALPAAETLSPHDLTRATEPQLDERAGDAAQEALFDRILALPIAEGRTIATLLSLHSNAEMDLRHFVAENHLVAAGRTRQALNMRETDAWITSERLTELLRKVVSQHFDNIDVQQVALASNTSDIIRATGRVSLDHVPVLDKRGWRHLDAHRLEQTTRACKTNALESSLALIGRLQLSPQMTINTLRQKNPRFDNRLRTLLTDQLPSELVYQPHGVCSTTMTLQRTDIIRLLALSAHDAKLSERVDFSKLAGSAFQTEWTLHVYAVPPPPRTDPFALSKTHTLPACPWPEPFLTANGQSQHKTFALQRATLDAQRQLWLKIEALPLNHDQTLGELLSHHDQAPLAIRTIENAILAAPATQRDDYQAEVQLTLPLEIIWPTIYHLTRIPVAPSTENLNKEP